MSELAIGKVIKMACMRSGLVAYPKYTVLLTKESLERMAPTIQGVPVVMDHPDVKITDQNIAGLPVVGRVADMHYDEQNEVWLAHFVVDDAQAVQYLQQGYGVSTAWFGDKYAAGGTYNNVPYDKELIDGRYEHLAIVANPRYEMASDPIFLNSKDGQIDQPKGNINTEQKKESVSMLGKLIKKVTQREEIMVNSNENLLVEIDGVETPLKDVIEVVAELNRNAKKMVNGDDEVDVDGKKMSVNELIDAYKSSKKNSAPEEKKENESESEKKDDEKKENESESEKKDDEKKDDEKKENSVDADKEQKETVERFNELDNAHLNAKDDNVPSFLSLKERVDMGRKRYGSAK